MADNKEKLQWQAEFPEEDTGEEERLRRKWERQQELKNARKNMPVALTLGTLIIVTI